VGEDGVALIVAMMAVLLLSALGFALVMTTSTESMIASNYRSGEEALYAADAALERSMDDLLTVADWNTLLTGATRSAFIDGPPSGPRTLSDGTTFRLEAIVNMANCGKGASCSPADIIGNATGDRPWEADNPVWQLYAYGPINDLVPSSTIHSPHYVVVLLGDDPSENDGDPAKDSVDPLHGGGVLALRAEAFGPRGVHKVIEMTVARNDRPPHDSGTGPDGVRILSWRHVR
jgi:hypothetical protein